MAGQDAARASGYSNSKTQHHCCHKWLEMKQIQSLVLHTFYMSWFHSLFSILLQLLLGLVNKNRIVHHWFQCLTSFYLMVYQQVKVLVSPEGGVGMEMVQVVMVEVGGPSKGDEEPGHTGGSGGISKCTRNTHQGRHLPWCQRSGRKNQSSHTDLGVI